MLPLHKVGCTQQFASTLALRSFALPLHKVGCTREFESKLSIPLVCTTFATINKAT
ncbi:hypothetical protein HMPREF3218_0200311 [Prevotella bivia]|nr:hypothetical protein HMPREF3218_0200311 [Prevotella bivia]